MIFDGRNLYEPADVARLGFEYFPIGRAAGRGEAVKAKRQGLPDLTKARVLVVGDVMLDRYWFGDVSRISPEAPVPVVQDRAHRGAARRRGERRAQLRRARRAGRPAVGRGRRRGGERARAAGRAAERRAREPAPRRHARHHGQAARDRPPAAAAAHRFRDLALARGARRQAGRVRGEPRASTTSCCSPTTAKAGSTHIERMIDASRAPPASRCWSIPRATTTRATAARTVLTPNRNELREVVGRWKDEADLNAPRTEAARRARARRAPAHARRERA